MKCPHCGEELPEGYVYIPSEAEEKEEPTGAEASAEAVTETENMNAAETAEDTGIPVVIPEPAVPGNITPYTGGAAAGSPKKFRLAGIAAAAAVIIAAMVIGIHVHATSALRSKMTGTWASAGNIMTTGKLTITRDTIAYSETFGFMEMNGQTVSYKAVSKDTIEIQGIKRRISFDSSNGTMSITPGIMSNSAEIWYSTSMQSIPEQNGSESSGEENAPSADEVL